MTMHETATERGMPAPHGHPPPTLSENTQVNARLDIRKILGGTDYAHFDRGMCPHPPRLEGKFFRSHGGPVGRQFHRQSG